MDAHRIYDLTVIHFFKCIFNLGPRAINMLRAPRYLNPALLRPTAYKSGSHELTCQMVDDIRAIGDGLSRFNQCFDNDNTID